MQASEYLRMRYQSERHLALSLQAGVAGVERSVIGVASDIYSGLGRISWFSSCFIPSYNNVCQELIEEEIRTGYSIRSIYEYRDVIQQMFFLYFESVRDDIREGNSKGEVRKLARNGANVASSIAVSKVTRGTFAYALSTALSQSEIVTKTVMERLSGKVHLSVYFVHLFGIHQKAALAARSLKVIDPEYYWILYQAGLEMLYYFIEPVISEIINKVKSGAFGNLDDLISYVEGNYGV